MHHTVDTYPHGKCGEKKPNRNRNGSLSRLIYYYADALQQRGAVEEPCEPEWELFDLENDPCELNNVYREPAYKNAVQDLKSQLHRLQEEVGDERYEKDVD